MKERPILFSAPMVRAILDGSKTQTRRVVKGAEGSFWDHGKAVGHSPWKPAVCSHGILWDDGAGHVSETGPRCPYGQVGDWLWVRETWRSFGDSAAIRPPVPLSCQISYAADNSTRWCPVPVGAKGLFPAELKNRPSIHMPRWASRITLEITEVRVERLQAITEADAQAEGISPHLLFTERGREGLVPCFRTLWQSINGPESWEANPWVWVVSFRRVEGGQG